MGKDLLNDLLLLSGLLLLQTLATHAGLLLLVLEGLLDELNVLQTQLLADNVQISRGVDITLDVDNLSVVEASYDLEDGVDGANVRQERVAETSTGRRATGQTSNVVDRQVGRNPRLGLVFLAEPVIALVGNNDASFLGVNGCVWEVLIKVSGGSSD